MVERILLDSGGFWSRYGPPLAATLLAYGVICYASKRTIVIRPFWRTLLVALSIATIGLVVFAIFVVPQDLNMAVLLMTVASGLTPANFVIYRLSFGEAPPKDGGRDVAAAEASE